MRLLLYMSNITIWINGNHAFCIQKFFPPSSSPLPPKCTQIIQSSKAEKRRFRSYSEAAVMCMHVNCLCSIYPSGPLNTKLFSVASEVPELSVCVCTGEISLVCFPCSYTVFLSTCCWLPEK